MDQSYIYKVKRRDTVARWVITLGGITIILSVIAILVMIAKVAIPLFLPPQSHLIASQTLPFQGNRGNRANPDGPALLATGVDDYLETAYVLDTTGTWTFFDLHTHAILNTIHSQAPAAEGKPGLTLLKAENHGAQIYSLLWSDGSLGLEQVLFIPHFDAAGKRTITSEIASLGVFEADGMDGAPPELSIARRDDEGSLTRVSLMAGNRLQVTRVAVTSDFLGDSTSETIQYAIEGDLPGKLTAIVLTGDGSRLYGGTDNGYLIWWELNGEENARLIQTVQVFGDERAITALAMALGDISVLIGDVQGGLEAWFPVPTGRASGARELRRIHRLGAHKSPIRTITASQRDKTILSLDEAGSLHLDHLTSERRLLRMAGAQTPFQVFGITANGSGLAVLDGKGRLNVWRIHNPHPEISWRTLFGKVWYENYPEPAYVWQSSSASDDFEPKLSLTPLIFGTLKGTFYAMLFALPLAILGALYTSQFMRPGLRNFIKPTVEVMAAIPSVVIGFLAALWLAPRIETSVTSLFVSLLVVPAVILIALLAWQMLETVPIVRNRGRGYEFLMLAPVVLLGFWISLQFGPWIETHVLKETFSQWLYETFNERYDQRNCIIIAFALGFAVIPIIFTIADDALSNVPRNLTAASLALGASRWQTAWRIVLPSASPGIFAGAMIGFGRAVGETMIVLMATGNTPIIDMSIFNGMRTLSANIAVEIPEAPVDGTLYRVLFLTAVILFAVTFVINTVAEIVRQRLRKKYGQL